MAIDQHVGSEATNDPRIVQPVKSGDVTPSGSNTNHRDSVSSTDGSDQHSPEGSANDVKHVTSEPQSGQSSTFEDRPTNPDNNRRSSGPSLRIDAAFGTTSHHPLPIDTASIRVRFIIPGSSNSDLHHHDSSSDKWSPTNTSSGTTWVSAVFDSQGKRSAATAATTASQEEDDAAPPPPLQQTPPLQQSPVLPPTIVVDTMGIGELFPDLPLDARSQLSISSDEESVVLGFESGNGGSRSLVWNWQGDESRSNFHLTNGAASDYSSIPRSMADSVRSNFDDHSGSNSVNNRDSYWTEKWLRVSMEPVLQQGHGGNPVFNLILSRQ